MKRAMLILTLLLALLLTLCTAAQAGSAPKITVQPKDVTVSVGENAVFEAKANNVNGTTWRLVSPDGKEEILVKDVETRFPGVTISGRNGQYLTFYNVTAEMNGWSVYCTFGNNSGKSKTDKAVIHIRGMEDAQPATEETTAVDENAAVENNNGAVVVINNGPKTVTVIGAAITAEGYSGSSIDFSAKGTINFKVSCDSTPEYWVINGARYDFDQVPRVITVKELTYGMTIEAVMKGSTAQTLLSAEALQAKRTGDSLVATSKNADLCFITASGQGKGGWFRELNFTNDYENLATGMTEQGGQVTLRCRWTAVQGKKIAYWEFNKAKLYFGSYVTEFVVQGLNETMEYHPVTDSVATPEPGPVYYRVSCTGCTFSGGGYTNATSGSVPAGTQITVTTKYLQVYSWSVNGNLLQYKTKAKSDEGYYDDAGIWHEVWKEVEIYCYTTSKSITRTINKDTTIVCSQQIN